MQRIERDALRGHLENLILAVLERGEAHGLEVLRRLETAGCGALTLREGALYPALYRLEASGQVKAQWEDNSKRARGPRRRIYQSHPQGQATARQESGAVSGICARDRGHFGSTSMNESSLIQLKIIVERAVRPVIACT